MNPTVTWRITVQPWRGNRTVRVNLSRGTYSRHGHQKWELLRMWDASNDPQLQQVMLEASDCLLQLEELWRAGLDDTSAGCLT